MTAIIVVAVGLGLLTILLGLTAVVWVAVADRRKRQNQGLD